MMTTNERISFLLRAAARAEREGNLRAARVFRMMAADAHPASGFLETATAG